MTPHPAAEAAYWAVLSRNRIGDTATPERHREAIEAYIRELPFSAYIHEACAPLHARITELEAEVARLREALTLAANRLHRLVLDQDDPRRRLEVDDWTREARAALQPQPTKPGA